MDIVIDPSIKIIQLFAFDGCTSLNFSSIPEKDKIIQLLDDKVYFKAVFLGI